DAAERILQQATERFPLDPDSFQLFSTAAERQNHLDAARAALMRHFALVGDQAESTTEATRIGALSLRLNDVGTAIEWLQRAAAAKPDDIRVLTTLVDAQIRYGDYEAAK